MTKISACSPLPTVCIVEYQSAVQTAVPINIKGGPTSIQYKSGMKMLTFLTEAVILVYQSVFIAYKTAYKNAIS